MPDFSPSLNESRIAGGLPVGGVLGWSSSRIVPAVIPSNGCGVLVAELPNRPEPADAITRIQAFRHKPPSLDGMPLIWDAGHKNHFLSIYAQEGGESNIVLIHCSAPEVKTSAFAGIPTHWLNTPDGELECYLEKDANEFRTQAAFVEEFGIRKRAVMCQRIFPESRVMFNRNHVGLVNARAAAIGCYWSEGPLYNTPVSMAPGGPVLLLGAHEPTQTPIGPLYILPHGTGNTMSMPGRVDFDEPTGIFAVVRSGTTFYDQATDVFDTYPTGAAAEAMLTAASAELDIPRYEPVIETKLRDQVQAAKAGPCQDAN